MGQIKQLSSILISQIAAGEVVRDPSGIVKELIENALDAGATDITIDIEKGGMQRISVLDNGCGIAKDELSMALKRHATSKLTAFEDLESLDTLGFRGEALASMAAVSRLSLASRTQDQTEGFEVKEGGKAPAPIRMQVGTQVQLFDLFYNTPARRKFMRSERTEFSYIDQVVKHFSLKHFAVAFTLKHNGRVIRQVQAVQTEEEQTARLAALLGKDFAANALPVFHKDDVIKVEGWLARPLFTRASADYQIFFVNNRLVRDKGLSHAIKRAYQDIMLPNRFPAFVLFLTLDPKQVDVNIHPAKQEIKLQDARGVSQALYYAAHRVLVEDSVAQKKSKELPPSPPPFIKPSETQSSIPSVEAKPDTQMYVDRFKERLVDAVLNEQNEALDAPIPSSEPIRPRPAVTHTPTMAAPTVATAQKVLGPEAASSPPPLGFAIGQVKGIYVLAQNEEGLVVVDMHAAHERIVYEKLKAQYRDQGVARQALLIPETLSLSAPEAACLEERSELLLSFGIECDLLSAGEAIVRSIPIMLGKTDAKALVQAVLADLMSVDESQSIEKAVNLILATLACHSAIRANRTLSMVEMNALLRDIEQTMHSGYCNHGRPTHKVFSLKEMDGWFHRGQ